MIADADEKNNRRRLTLVVYQLVGEKYVRVSLDEHGRAWLAPVNLWLSIRVHPETGGDRLVLVDPATNEDIPDYRAVSQTLAIEKPARVEAEERVLAAEQRIRELETQLKRRGRGKTS